MSKQDGYASRTAADLERKYNFGQTFAEVYNLVSDARKVAEEAKNAYEGLDQEQIFNLLTNFGEAQGIYRDDTGNVYVNASYIKSGTISGENVKVAAATVTGELTAATIQADKISGGTLDFNTVTAKNLSVTTAQISGTLSASKISGGTLNFNSITISGLATSDLTNDSGFQNYSGVVSIVEGTVDADYINARISVTASELVSTGNYSWERVAIADGMIDFYSGYIKDMDFGYLEMSASNLWLRSTSDDFRIYTGSGNYHWRISSSGIGYWNGDTRISYINTVSG